MLTTANAALAIEAKYLEPPYGTVDAWLGPNPTENRRQVLQGWFDVLERSIGCALDARSAAEIPYQLIHRMASVCSVSRPRRFVIYQVFDRSKRAYYETELRRCREALGSSGIVLALALTSATPMSPYSPLLQRWDAGERDLSAEVKALLVAGSTFSFDPLEMIVVD